MVHKNKQFYTRPKITTKKIRITTFGTRKTNIEMEGLLFAGSTPYDCLY